MASLKENPNSLTALPYELALKYGKEKLAKLLLPDLPNYMTQEEAIEKYKERESKFNQIKEDLELGKYDEEPTNLTKDIEEMQNMGISLESAKYSKDNQTLIESYLNSINIDNIYTLKNKANLLKNMKILRTGINIEKTWHIYNRYLEISKAISEFLENSTISI